MIEPSKAQRFQTLALTFPCLAMWAETPGAGVVPFDINKLMAFRNTIASTAQRHVVNLLLDLWDGGHRHRQFDMFAALSAWDETHRQAFAAWARSPWAG